MFCQNCGAILSEGASFCGTCGTASASSCHEEMRNGAGLIGFSPKISDPAFKSYQKKSVAWSLIFSGTLAIIAVIGFPIYGNISGDIEWPGSLFYGFGIGGMFIAIALMQTVKKALDKTWDGEVISKDIYIIKERDRNGFVHHRKIYVIKIRKDSGGIKKHKWRNTPGLYDYYNTGDRVRHHKGFLYYEKYDKSGDGQIMCAACLSIQDISKDICPRCKCPLLK